MDDLILMLEEAVDKYTEEPSDGAYVGVVQTLLICMKYNVNLWSLGKVDVDENGAELMTPGMIAGDDNRYYYVLGMNEDAATAYSEASAGGMAPIKLNLNALATQIAGNGELGGICFNPWNGGCFVPREQIIRLLESLAASMFE